MLLPVSDCMNTYDDYLEMNFARNGRGIEGTRCSHLGFWGIVVCFGKIDFDGSCGRVGERAFMCGSHLL